ncbi:esterase, partial [Streptomyces sp. SID89]|nr:esterase [Streptomyces sp. SID89]
MARTSNRLRLTATGMVTAAALALALPAGPAQAADGTAPPPLTN